MLVVPIFLAQKLYFLFRMLVWMLWGHLDLFANDCNVPSYFFRHLCTCCLLVLYLLAVFALLLCLIAYSTTFFRNFISSVILIFIESLSLIILFVLNLFTRWLSIFLFFCHICIISQQFLYLWMLFLLKFE